MIPALKAEFRKMFTVRATYVIFLSVIILMLFFGFFVSGWKLSPHQLQDPGQLAGDVTGAIQSVSVFAALIAILLMTQEYRYNLIAYTLTSSNSRNKVLAAKCILCTVLGIVFTGVVGLAAPLLSVLGVHAHGLHLAPQTIHYSKLAWECLFYGWGYTMVGLLFAVLIRNQIGSIVVLFIAPDTVEGILGLVLKNHSVYLPFTALSMVIGQPMRSSLAHVISPSRAALVFIGYLAVGWVVAWMLFLRRDAMN